MTKDQIVRFRNPEDDEEANERYVVLEDRGDRVLVMPLEGFKDWEIVPTFVYAVNDLEIISQPFGQLD